MCSLIYTADALDKIKTPKFINELRSTYNNGGSDSDDDTRYNPTDFRSSVAFFNGATVSQNTLDTSFIVEIR